MYAMAANLIQRIKIQEYFLVIASACEWSYYMLQAPALVVASAQTIHNRILFSKNAVIIFLIYVINLKIIR